MRFSVAGSVLLHLGFALGTIVLVRRPAQPIPPAVIPPTTAPIEIEYWGESGLSDLLKPPSRSTTRSARQRSAHRPAENLPSPPVALKDLGLTNPLAAPSAPSQSSPNHPSPETGSETTTADDGTTNRAEDTRAGSPFGYKNQITEKASPVLSYLYHQINGGIGYPTEIYDAWLQGDVTATLRFDADGKWIDDPAAIKGYDLGSRYLRIHVWRRLRALLEAPIPPNIWKGTPQPFTVDTRFLFVIVAPEGVAGAQMGAQFESSIDPSHFSHVDKDNGQALEARINLKQQGTYGNSLFFYRSHLASKLAWKLGPFAGYGFMPAVGVSPSWFVETLTNWWHHRAKIDPLEKYRDDPEW